MGESKVSRRFIPLPTKLKAVHWSPEIVKGIGQAMAGISVNGDVVVLIDPLEGGAKVVHESSCKITAMTWSSSDSLLLGTIDGKLHHLMLNHAAEKPAAKSISEFPIRFVSKNAILDSHGRLFYEERIVFDDGILQPCALIELSAVIFFVKWKNVYQFDKQTGSVSTWTLEEVNAVFVHATYLQKSLICVTDANELFFLGNDGLKRVSKASEGTITPIHVSDVEDDDGDVDSEADENGADEAVPERTRIFGICSYGGRVAVLLGSPVHKSAWIEITELSSSPVNRQKQTFSETFVDITCPLCPSSHARQRLTTIDFACNQGHPISICSEALTRIDSPYFYRCRQCNRCYKRLFDSCPVCGYCLKKTNK